MHSLSHIYPSLLAQSVVSNKEFNIGLFWRRTYVVKNVWCFKTHFGDELKNIIIDVPVLRCYQFDLGIFHERYQDCFPAATGKMTTSFMNILCSHTKNEWRLFGTYTLWNLY